MKNFSINPMVQVSDHDMKYLTPLIDSIDQNLGPTAANATAHCMNFLMVNYGVSAIDALKIITSWVTE